METKRITEEMYLELTRPLPAEAITQHPTKTYLSSIKGIYITERLNRVFGTGAWTTKVEKIAEYVGKENKNGDAPLMVVIKTTLEIPEYGVYYESYGGNDNADEGDAYKGATTDAISKIGSYLGIGIDVYKGKKAPKKGGVTEQEEEPFTSNRGQNGDLTI